MRREVPQPPRTVIECDGCDYVLGRSQRQVEAGVQMDDVVATFSVPWDGGRLEFHFHADGEHRHDCFRYWAHSPHVMKRSLAARDLDEGEIDRFMSVHLYRTHPHGSGVARPTA